MSKYRADYKRPMVAINCACGAARRIRRSCIGKIILCAGCAKREGSLRSAAIRKASAEVTAFNDAWSVYRCNAKRRNLIFSLSKEEFRNLRGASCVYCGSQSPNGVDRYDNRIGYTKENAVSCCRLCNYAKRDMPAADFIAWAKRVYENSL